MASLTGEVLSTHTRTHTTACTGKSLAASHPVPGPGRAADIRDFAPVLPYSCPSSTPVLCHVTPPCPDTVLPQQVWLSFLCLREQTQGPWCPASGVRAGLRKEGLADLRWLTVGGECLNERAYSRWQLEKQGAWQGVGLCGAAMGCEPWLVRGGPAVIADLPSCLGASCSARAAPRQGKAGRPPSCLG